MNKKDYWIGLLSGLLISVFIVCCVLCGRMFLAPVDKYEQSSAQASGSSGGRASSIGRVNSDSDEFDDEVIEKINLLKSAIEYYYVEDLDEDVLADGLYSGLMDSLGDPYAEYYTPDQWIAMQNSTEGIYYGIGAYMKKDTVTGYPQITGIIRDTPAEEAGILIDDYIYEVDGTDVFDMNLSDVTSMIKGPEGTTVMLTIIRPSTGEELEMTLERRKVETPTVEYKMLEGNIGYISIAEFDTVTVDQFAEALATVKGNGMEGLILDLRGNPGGSLSAVVEIARMLLPEGLIVYTEDKYGERNEYSCDGKRCIDVPMIVLVNGGSASASEILAGAIKDYGIGTLLGTTTYGKGIVQRLIALDDGSAIKLTVSHYYTPLGNDIHKIGIVPDIELEFDADAYKEDETDNQLERAIELLQRKMQ
ncbi:MAG: S41 family peptidase [Lachnospiraceae bacterium]|nr:S41 family peptidase [Lachnospiraceae bacterium]